MLLLCLAIRQANAQAQMKVHGAGKSHPGTVQGVAPLAIVGSPFIQGELGVNDQTSQALDSLAEAYRVNFYEACKTSKKEMDRRRRQQSLMEIGKSVSEKLQPHLNELLNEKQRVRLREMAVRAAGAHAFADPAIIKELGLTKEQTEKIATISEGFNRTDNPGFGPLRDEQVATLTAVLTKDQQAQFTKMEGKPFNITLAFQHKP
jgi:DNA-binding MarR family transcriptional regulator